MTLVERLKQYMEYKGMPSTQFADVAKVARPTISQILNGRNRKVSNELLEKIHHAFPTLNMMWLLFGDGLMETVGNTQISEPQNKGNLFDVQTQTTNNQTTAQSPIPTEQNSIPLRNSTMREFVAQNTYQPNTQAESGASAPQIQEIAATQRDESKRIETIIVYYTDKSYEIFNPAPLKK